MRLQYDIQVGNQQQMRAVLRGIEREQLASNRRLAADQQRTARATRAAATPSRTNVKAAEQLDRQRSNALLAEFRRQERERIASERRIARAAESLDRQRSRSLAALHREQERQQRRDIADISKGVGRPRRGGGGLARAGSSVVGLGGTAFGMGASLVGGIAAANAIREESAVRRSASMLANQAGQPEIKGQLAAEAQSVRGFSGEEVLSGITEFVTKTGDLDAARALIKDLGDLSLATGADLGDLGATAGQAFNVLKDQISDPVQQLKELKALMGALAQQGALGAVEIRDLARDFGKLGAATRGFEGGAPDLLRTMGAFAQVAVARGGAESSADASTAASRLVNDMVTHKDKFKKLGVSIQSKKEPTKLRDPMAIMADVLEKTGGDVMKTSGLFGLESGKIFKGFAATFSEAEKKKKGSGRAAVMKEFERFAGAKLDPEQVAQRAASRLEDPDLQFQETAKEFNKAISKELLPAVTALIPEFVKLVPLIAEATKALTKFVGFFFGDSQKPKDAPGDRIDDFLVSENEDFFSQKTLDNALNTAKVVGKGIGHGLTFNAFRDDPAAPKKVEPPGAPKVMPPGMKPSVPGQPGSPAATPAVPGAQTPAAAEASTQTKAAGTELAAFTSEVSKARKELAGLRVPQVPDASRTAPIISPSRN